MFSLPKLASARGRKVSKVFGRSSGFLLAGALFFFGRYALTAQQSSSPQVNLQVIVVETQEKAQEALARLKKGDDFAALAKQVSIDPSASSGGFVGNVDPSTLRPELRAALAGLKPGELSDAVKVPTGFVILKLLPEKTLPAGRGTGAAAAPSTNAPGQGMGPNRDLHLAGKALHAGGELVLAHRCESRSDLRRRGGNFTCSRSDASAD